MFDFDAGKIIVIGVVALVVIGPKELPRVMRQVGQTVGKLRRMAGEFQAQFMEAMREAEMTDVKEEMAKIAETAKIDVAFDPVRHIRNEIGNAIAGETKPEAIAAGAASLPELPSEGIDLTTIGTPNAEGAADATATEEAGLVASGIAPQPEGGTGQNGGTTMTSATLDDVREALSEELGPEQRHVDADKPLVKEHTA